MPYPDEKFEVRLRSIDRWYLKIYTDSEKFSYFFLVQAEIKAFENHTNEAFWYGKDRDSHWETTQKKECPNKIIGIGTILYILAPGES